MIEHQESPDISEFTAEILKVEDNYAIIERLGSCAPVFASEIYAKLQLELYWNRKDIFGVIALSRAGIQHCLVAAHLTTYQTQAEELRVRAKALSYNLASFTWPGWDQNGIELTKSDIAIGLEAARLNLRLAVELDRPAKAKANAFWLLGAHEIAADRLPEATETFSRGMKYAVDGGEPLLGQMLEGYARLSQVLADASSTEARKAFDRAVAHLKEGESEEAQEYARQLPVVLAFFSAH